MALLLFVDKISDKYPSKDQAESVLQRMFELYGNGVVGWYDRSDLLFIFLSECQSGCVPTYTAKYGADNLKTAFESAGFRFLSAAMDRPWLPLGTTVVTFAVRDGEKARELVFAASRHDITRVVETLVKNGADVR